MTTRDERAAARVAELAVQRGLTVAVAESLTGGQISTALAAAEQAGQWYRGAVVAYSTEVKHEVLGVPTEEVVHAEAASAMARRTREMLLADVAVAVTGAGGPSPQDGREPGTVFLALDAADHHRVARLQFDGDEPMEVLSGSTSAALDALVAYLEGRD
ncbi:CinA family protein [Pseudonocardia humida]|uniref:CinA family protein n=1 Tax=Pseudonocardia humida TaxID=2800819 RepID=A0ABT1A2I9_9PSEU|nr:CinA family protein [Pseudonocardia humida]MCO1657212.1 CinA family protein [Pseudonocardia humida]